MCEIRMVYSAYANRYTLAPNLTATSSEALAALFDSTAKCRNLLDHHSDTVDLDESVEAAQIAFAESKRLADEHKVSYDCPAWRQRQYL